MCYTLTCIIFTWNNITISCVNRHHLAQKIVPSLSVKKYIWPTLVSLLRPEQKGRHLSYDIFKFIFVNQDVYVFQKSLTLGPMGRVGQDSTLAQVTVWRRTDTDL